MVCKCREHSGGGVTAPDPPVVVGDDPMGAPETALVVWRPPEDRAQLLVRLRAENQQQVERARKRAEDAASQRHSPY